MRRIRAVFMNDWDPIGVRDIPECTDEYDSYVVPLYSILRQRRSETALLNFLQGAYRDMMGITVPSEESREIATKFLEIDVSHDEIHQ